MLEYNTLTAYTLFFNKGLFSMDFVPAAILGGILFDSIKYSTVLTIDILKQKLVDWVVGDSVAASIIKQAEQLEAEGFQSEQSLIENIDNSPRWQSIMQEIKPVAVKNIQNNYGVVADTIEAKLVVGTNAGGIHFHEAPEVKPEKKS
jgi:hypothetical protein